MPRWKAEKRATFLPTACLQTGTRDPDLQRRNYCQDQFGFLPPVMERMRGRVRNRADFLYPYKIHPQPGPQCPSLIPLHPSQPHPPHIDRQIEASPLSSQFDKIEFGFSVGVSHSHLLLDAHVTPTSQWVLRSGCGFNVGFEAFHRGNQPTAPWPTGTEAGRVAETQKESSVQLQQESGHVLKLKELKCWDAVFMKGMNGSLGGWFWKVYRPITRMNKNSKHAIRGW